MPYAPTVNNNSGQILAAGIMGGVSSIADAITKNTAETKKLKAYRSMAVDGLGLDPEEVDKMDLPTLEGKMEALAVKNVMEGAAQRRQQMQFAAEDQGFQRDANARAQAEADYQAKQREAATRFMQDPGFSGVGPTGPVQPTMDPRSIMAAAARAGYDMSPRDIAQLMEQGKTQEQFFQRGDADQATPIAPGFLRAVLGPNTSQVIPDMSAASTAVPIKGPNGEDLGYALPGRSGVTPLKTGTITDKDQFEALQAEKRALIAAKGRSAPSAMPAYDAAIAKLDEALAGLQKPASVPAKPAGGKGARYNLVNGQLVKE